MQVRHDKRESRSQTLEIGIRYLDLFLQSLHGHTAKQTSNKRIKTWLAVAAVLDDDTLGGGADGLHLLEVT